MPAIAWGQAKYIPTNFDSLQIINSLKNVSTSNQTTSSKIKSLESILAIAERSNFKKGTALCNFEIGKIYASMKEWNNSLSHLTKAQNLFSEIHDEFYLGQTEFYLGETYTGKSNFRQAFDHLKEASTLLRKTNQQKLLEENLEKLGELVLKFGQVKNAIIHFKRALAIKNSLGDKSGAMDITIKLSNIYINQKQHDSAMVYIKEGQKLAKGNTDIYAEASIYEYIVLAFQGKFSEALNAQKNIEKLLAINNNQILKIKFAVANANYFLAIKERSGASKYFDAAAEMIEKAKSPELAIEGLKIIAEMSELNEDYKTAYRMQKQMDRYKDIFRNENIDRISAEIKNTAEANLREKEIEFLNQKNTLANQKIKQEELLKLVLSRENSLVNASLKNQEILTQLKTNEAVLKNKQLAKEKDLSQSLSRENQLKQKYLEDERRNKNILWVGLAILTLATGMIFWQYKKQFNQNEIIKKQAAELHVLNKEIHHRVKNNLQVISSLLDLQSHTLPNDRSKAIIKEGIQRVQSMAFIHQNLYEGEAANAVNINEYLKMLSTHLFQTYNIKPNKIKLHTDIENLKFHTDTAIPIGMILNELISNALKYAFPNNNTGDIWVVLKEKDNKVLLSVKDNGVGLPPNFETDKSHSLGFEIITAFLQKLKAKMNINNVGGTEIEILISKYKLG